MARIKIKDLNVSLEELKKKDPNILNKIRGGYMRPPAVKVMVTGLACPGGGGGSSTTSSGGSSTFTCAGMDTMGCDTTKTGGCQPGSDTMFCDTKTAAGGCAPFYA